MREIDPVLPGDEFHQRLLDLFGSALPGETETTREAQDVGVNDDAFRFAKGDAEDDVGGFSANAVKLDEFVKRAGDFAVVVIKQGAAAIADGIGFVAEETGGVDEGFEFCRYGVGEIVDGFVPGEEGRGDLVDSFVGALGAEDGGDEELERILMAEGATNVRMGAAEGGNECRYFGLGRFHGTKYSIAVSRRVAAEL